MAEAITSIEPAITMPVSLPATAQTSPIAPQTTAPSSAAPSEKACISSRCRDAVMLAPHPGLSQGTLAAPGRANLDQDQKPIGMALAGAPASQRAEENQVRR